MKATLSDRKDKQKIFTRKKNIPHSVTISVQQLQES